MNTEVGRNLLWNETKVCSLWKKERKKKKEEEVRQPPGLGLLSVGISIQWPIMRRVYAMIRLGDVSHCVFFFFFFLFNRAAVTGRARLGSLSQHASALIVSEQRAAPDNETRTPTSWPCCLIIQRWMEIKDLTHTLFIMWETCHSCQCRRGGGGGGSILICFTLLSSPCPRVSGSLFFFSR